MVVVVGAAVVVVGAAVVVVAGGHEISEQAVSEVQLMYVEPIGEHWDSRVWLHV